MKAVRAAGHRITLCKQPRKDAFQFDLANNILVPSNGSRQSEAFYKFQERLHHISEEIYVKKMNIDELCINTIRMLSADAVQKANSGHPGMPMGDAAMAYVLWTKFLKHNPKNPKWQNRDRFVLSAGHGSMLLYSLLHLTGHKISLEDIKNFRQWESPTPGHPEYCPECGIETTTGPLGQGFATGVGMAIAEKYLSDTFNKPGFPVVDYNIYGIVSDGDLMEGVSSEAASLAGHLKLGKIVYLYSDNKITIEGSTDLSFTEDVFKRFAAYDWHVQRVEGDDLKGIEKAIATAKKEKNKPSIILVRTHIGCCSPNKQDTADVHGSPLGEEELKLTKQELGWPDRKFFIPTEALNHMRKAVRKGSEAETSWKGLFSRYVKKYPSLAEKWSAFSSGKLPEGWETLLPVFTPADGVCCHTKRLRQGSERDRRQAAEPDRWFGRPRALQ